MKGKFNKSAINLMYALLYNSRNQQLQAWHDGLEMNFSVQHSIPPNKCKHMNSKY